ncbi:isoprenylcysteine carboxylmethyltransferase family protein [Candidatus Fermentibacterales bacterium]|nr:isoprenylcysteine carboxylmethyltransferase family protein [Candidatus Fermentibacterales bacterium]
MRRVLPPDWFLVAVLLSVILHLVVPLKRVLSFPWCAAGLVPVAAGVWLNLAADRAFKRSGTVVSPFETPFRLVTGGVFRISRHPMYLGMVLILLGVALLLGSVTPFAVPVMFGLLVERLFVGQEEQTLQRQFADDYLRYRRRVRKWI